MWLRRVHVRVALHVPRERAFPRLSLLVVAEIVFGEVRPRRVAHGEVVEVDAYVSTLIMKM